MTRYVGGEQLGRAIKAQVLALPRHFCTAVALWHVELGILPNHNYLIYL